MTTPSTIEAQKGGIVKALDPQENVYRLEIDEFVQDTPVLNIFLLALEALQDNSVLNPNENDNKEAWEKYWWSYYCIAGKILLSYVIGREFSRRTGIHGEPSGQAWLHEHNGSADDLGWYCKHGSTLFPTWHRSYVIMMEVY